MYTDQDLAFGHNQFDLLVLCDFDVKGGTNRLHNLVAGSHAQRPVLIRRHLDMNLTTLKAQQSIRIRIRYFDASVRIQNNLRAVVQNDRRLLANLRLKHALRNGRCIDRIRLCINALRQIQPATCDSRDQH